MKFIFKMQRYQTEAVESVVKIFNGQRKTDKLSYRRDVGTYKGGIKANIRKMEYYGLKNTGPLHRGTYTWCHKDWLILGYSCRCGETD